MICIQLLKGLGSTCLIFALTLLLWRFGVRHYRSTGS